MSAPEARVTAWKLLDPSGCTHRHGKEYPYALPRPDEKWGPWITHPATAKPNGEACGAGGYHFMRRLAATPYAPQVWWPWYAELRDVLGQDDHKIRAATYRLRRVSRLTWWGLIRRGSAGPRLVRATLSCAQLRHANLRGAKLNYADLYSANLRDADLSYANLYSADLRGANLRGANLYSADLRAANLRGADLYSADLRAADLRAADLRGANLYSAELRGANLLGALRS